MEIALRIHRVAFGEKKLRYRVAIVMEKALVHIHEKSLPYRGGCLLVREEIRFLLKSQDREPHANGAGGNENHFHAPMLHIGNLARQMVQETEIHLPVFIGQGAGAHLHDDALFRFDFFSIKAIHNATSYLSSA